MRERVLLLVDLSYQTYRAAAAHPRLESDGVFTGGLYGFWMNLGKAVRETGATDIAVCQDRKPYVRSLAYPDYKLLRKKAADDDLLRRFEASTPLVLESLAAVGVDPWGVPGFESDDLIGCAVRGLRHRYARIYAASNDADLYQLLGVPNFAVYAKDIADVMTGERLMSLHGVTPEQYALATALMGTHNDIAGIPDVGIKTALAAVKKPSLLRGLMADHRALVERNLALIALPHPDLPRTAMPEPRGGDSRDLMRMLGRYDVSVTQAMREAVEQINRRR